MGPLLWRVNGVREECSYGAAELTKRQSRKFPVQISHEAKLQILCMVLGKLLSA